MNKLDRLKAYIDIWMPDYYRLMAALTEFGSVERPATIRPVARLWFEAGIPAQDAVAWFATGLSPTEALQRITDGRKPIPLTDRLLHMERDRTRIGRICRVCLTFDEAGEVVGPDQLCDNCRASA